MNCASSLHPQNSMVLISTAVIIVDHLLYYETKYDEARDRLRTLLGARIYVYVPDII